MYTDRYDLAFQAAADVLALDWRTMKAQAIAESGLNPNARSPAGAIGCAQFLRSTWDWLAQKYGLEHWSILDCIQSIFMLAIYMREHLDFFRARGLTEAEAEALAIASYNRGRGGVLRSIAKAGGKIAWSTARAHLPQETLRYEKRIRHLRSLLARR